MIPVVVVAGLVALAPLVRLLRPRMSRISVDLAAIEVLDSRGRPVRLDAIIDRPTLLVLPRYYG